MEKKHLAIDLIRANNRNKAAEGLQKALETVAEDINSFLKSYSMPADRSIIAAALRCTADVMVSQLSQSERDLYELIVNHTKTSVICADQSEIIKRYGTS